MSKKQQPSQSATDKSNLIKLEQYVTKFSEYLSILESFLENIDRPRNSRALNQFDLHRITGEETFVVNDQKNGGTRLSHSECAKIQDIDRRRFLFILALNWLVARFVKLNDDKEIEYSQSALFRRIKRKEELLCGRLSVVQLQLTEDQKKLQNLQKQFVRRYGVGLPAESDWGKRYSIHDYATYFFPVDRKSLEKVDPKCLFISIMMRLSLPEDAVPLLPGKQIAATSTSSEAASRASKRHITTSDDENGSEDDEVEDMTNQKLQSKGINSVKRQKTKTSDGEKASAAREEEREEEEEEEENDENDQEEGEEGEGRNEEEDEDDEEEEEEEEEEKEEENQQSTATRRKVKLSSTKRNKNQEVEFEGDDDVELTTEEQAEQDLAVNALTTFEQTNFQALKNMPSDTSVLLSFQNLMLELLEDNMALKNKEFTVSVQLLITFVTLRQRFSTFFLMCEALPEIYAGKAMGGIGVGEEEKQSFVQSAVIYLSKVATNLLKIFKKCRKMEESTDAREILDKVFPGIGPAKKESIAIFSIDQMSVS